MEFKKLCDTIINGDCLVELKKFPENSVDAILTDPPYELGFMSKKWDATGIAYNVDMWEECLRVLKPGGHLLSFGGTRTYHRMACAIEDAGFEIRDCIFWCYGSGFPKSLDISKQLQKKSGKEPKVITRNPNSRENCDKSNTLYESGTVGKTDYITEPTDENAKKWEGWGTSLKPAVEPIVIARKPISGKTIIDNVLKHGTGGINIEESRIGIDGDDDRSAGRRTKTFGKNAEVVSGGEGSPDYVPNNKGRFPSNLILGCSCEKTIQGKAKGSKGHWSKTKTTGFGKFGDGKSEYNGIGDKDNMDCQVHTNPNCACYMLDQQSGKTKSSDNKWLGENNAPLYGKYNQGIRQSTYSDTGGASRFFKNIPMDSRMIYAPKASKKERNMGCEELPKGKPVRWNKGGKWTNNTTPATNNHPTVKNLLLMEYLVKLITPPNGIVLDPFAGSGSTCIAAKNLGFRFIGIEKEKEYCDIAKARLKVIQSPII